MLTHFFGAEDIAYTGEVMKMHMMGAIRRLYEPGAKYDIMLCLVRVVIQHFLKTIVVQFVFEVIG